jgi:NAD(P)H-dependent FMN reductase
VHLLGLGGSLRTKSWNRALLDAAAEMVPGNTRLDLSQLDVAGSLPLFNQELEDSSPAGVSELKDSLSGADGLLIASPEYNWGIPGYLKNAIDWASRPAADIPRVFGDLPVVVIGAGGFSGTRYAQVAWQSVFRYLKMRPWFGHTLFIDRAWERFDEEGRLSDADSREQLQAVVSGFVRHCAELPRARSS